MSSDWKIKQTDLVGWWASDRRIGGQVLKTGLGRHRTDDQLTKAVSNIPVGRLLVSNRREGTSWRIKPQNGMDFYCDARLFALLKGVEDVGNGKPMAVYAFQLQDLSLTEETTSEPAQVNVLGDVALELEVELGRTEQRIGQILEWEKGTVITLDKLAGESAEVLLNDSVIAKGEVIVIDGKLAVRVVEISGLEERLGDIL